MPTNIGGFDPVAELREINGDMFQTADYIADHLSGEFAIVTVVNGGLYICEVVDDYTEAHWAVIAEVGEGETGSWDMETDRVSEHLPEEHHMVDVLGSHHRYIVEEA